MTTLDGLAKLDGFAVRAADDSDLNYVRKTWLQEHAQEGVTATGSTWIDAVGGGAVYFREHKIALDAALRRGAITIACRASVPNGICGFAVTESELVHFVYVKPRWRQLGVAKLLLRPFASTPAQCTHRTRIVSRLPVPSTWAFNPYPFLRSDHE